MTPVALAARQWTSRHRGDLLLVLGLWAVTSAIMWPLANGHVTLRRFQDEFLFWELAQSVARGHGLEWRGVALPIRSPLYPWLIAIGFLPEWGVLGSYKAVHLINALTMSAVVFPVFALARFLVDRRWALAAAVLAVSVPAMNYVGIVGTENLGYPVSAAALGAMVVAIGRPQRRWSVAAFVCMLIAVLTRTQFIVLLPVFAMALIVAATLSPSGRRVEFLRQRRELAAALAAALVVGAITWLVARGRLLGIYDSAFTEFIPPTLDSIVYWARGFTADVWLLAGILPTLACLALALDREARRDPLVAGLVAVAAVASITLVAQVTWFSASNPYGWREKQIFYERYMFYLGPLFFVAFVTALRRRVAVQAIFVATGISAVVVSLFDSNNVMSFSYDSFGLTLIGDLLVAQPGFGEWLGLGLALAAIALGAVLALTSREAGRHAMRGAPAALAVVMLILSAGQARTWKLATIYSHNALTHVPAPYDFIDRATERPVAMFITATDSESMYFSTEFWNDRVVRALLLPDSPVVYSPTCRFEPDATGLVRVPGCDFIPSAYYLRSQTLAIKFSGIERITEPQPGVQLIVVKAPARVEGIIGGRDVITGEVRSTLTVRTFGTRPFPLRVTVDRARDAARVVINGDDEWALDRDRPTRVVAAVAAGDRTTVFELIDSRDDAGKAVITGIDRIGAGGKAESLIPRHR